MDRRTFLKGASLAAFAPLALSGASSTVSDGEAPNILLIVSDDQPFYTVCSRYMPKTLPAFSGGLSFSKAYANSPQCSPARATLHTGLYAHNHGVVDNPNATRRFLKAGRQHRSIGPILRSAGYRTGYFGKWMNGYEEKAAWTAPGYDRWVGILANRNPVMANINGRIRKKNTTPRKWETRWLGEEAASFCSGTEPWFCFASIKAPHQPYDPSPNHDGQFSAEPIGKRVDASGNLFDAPSFDHYDPNKPEDVRRGPLSGQDKAHIATHLRGKLEETGDLDDAIADLFAAVDLENTYVFFTSDNGALLGEHRAGGKSLPYEESCRVPLLVKGPGVRNAGVSAPVGLVDIAPTILELAGLDPGEGGWNMDGRSLVGHMVGTETGLEEEEGTSEVEWRDGMLLEIPRKGGWRALRTGTNLYVEHSSGDRELYDMDPASPSYDPYQLANIAPETDGAAISEHSMKLASLREVGGEALRAAEVNEV